MPSLPFRLAALSLAAAAFALTGCPAGPEVRVHPAAFNFGANKTSDTATISSTSGHAADWTIENGPDWLALSPESGRTAPGAPSRVTLTVDRSGLEPGSHNGGFDIVTEQRAQRVAVTLFVSDDPPDAPGAFSVAPASLDFGVDNTAESLSIRGPAGEPIAWSAEPSEPWLSITPAEGETGDEPTEALAEVDRDMLDPGVHEAVIAFAHNGEVLEVPVRAEAEGPAPILSVAPEALDLGARGREANLTVRNTGTGVLEWEAATDVDWLSVNPQAGTAGASGLRITVRGDRDGLDAGSHEGVVTVSSNGGSATIPVSMEVEEPSLEVNPEEARFGPHATRKLITVANPGAGSVNWSIPTGAFPDWLSAEPTSGSVGTEQDGVLLTVDRGDLEPGEYTHDLTVESGAGDAAVSVRMTVAVTPVLTVEAGAANASGLPLAAFGADRNEATITIRNTGTGQLDWSIPSGEFPSWLSASPVAGSQGESTQTVTFIVDRTGLDAGGYSHVFEITSNGGAQAVEAAMQVPVRPVISTDPARLEFGLDGHSEALLVFNSGDPGSLLRFRVDSDRPWLFFNPRGGISQGVDSDMDQMDFRRVNVAIDRGNLEETGPSGNLTIRAVDGSGEPVPGVDPKAVPVSVEIAPLRFALAPARLRSPGLARFTTLMRDFRDEVIHADAADLDPAAFDVLEDDAFVDWDETNLFLSKDVRGNLIVLLDYSGSAAAAAEAIEYPGDDPLQAMYEDTVIPFLHAVPDNFAVGLMEFHEQDGANWLHGFTQDRDALADALRNANVEDRGASAILPALEQAAVELQNADRPFLSFDNADVRAIALVSDGRRTTPPGDLSQTEDLFEALRTQLFSVGWGMDVDNEMLATLASESGGQHYPTLATAEGLPQVPELERRLEGIASDLGGFMTLAYASLNQEDGVETRVEAVFDAPHDPAQGEIQGFFEQQIEFAAVTGDVRMGQIHMRASGDGSAVVIGADFIPRGVRGFRFVLDPPGAFVASRVSPDNGGLVSDWLLEQTGNEILLTAPDDGDALPYGAFGGLVRVQFQNSPSLPYVLGLEVDNARYAGQAEPKYFIHPQNIEVVDPGSLAPSFPTPAVEPSHIDFGAGLDSATVTVRNIGGALSAPPAPVAAALNWEAAPPGFVDVEPAEGVVDVTLGEDTLTLTVDRTLAPGVYSGELAILYNVGIPGAAGVATVTLEAIIEEEEEPDNGGDGNGDNNG